MKCAVAKCLENNCKKSASGKSVTYYRFPKDTAQRKLWEIFCNREDSVNVKDERICSLHFKEVDFERNLKFEMGFSTKSALKLKPGAVPTIDPTFFASEKLCNEENTPMMTDSNEDNVQPTTLNKDEIIHGQQLYIKTLESKIDALRQENQMLKLTQSQVAISVKNLTSDVQSLSLVNENLEKSLRRLFTQGQIEKLKSGNRRKNFTHQDIAQSLTLYATSAKTYRFLIRNYFPLPSVRTLQRWSQKLDVSTGILKPVVQSLSAANQMSQTQKLCVLSFDEMKSKKKNIATTGQQTPR